MSTKIYLKDIAGYQEEKEEAVKIIEVLKNIEKYSEMGAYVPKGLILNGNPGVGKTMLAKAIATESGVPFYEFENEECENDEETILTIKELFNNARKNAPSIIFIDELDELLSNQNFTSDYSRKITKILLTEIDGISNSEGVIVIGTTNNKYDLPRAVTRSGRMDKQITMPLPSKNDREEIFKLYLGKTFLKDSIDVRDLAIRTQNLSGADIKTLINETIIDCSSKGISNISIRDFERNIANVLYKEIKKKNLNGPSDLTCYHEIGHFVCAYACSGKIGNISVEKIGESRGRVFFYETNLEEDDFSITIETLKNYLVEALGGMAGEKVMLNDISSGSTSDVNKARKAIRILFETGAFSFEYLPPAAEYNLKGRIEYYPESAKERLFAKEVELLNDAFNECCAIIESNKELVTMIYKELKVKEALTEKELTNIISIYKGKENANVTKI